MVMPLNFYPFLDEGRKLVKFGRKNARGRLGQRSRHDEAFMLFA
jgi:hypothetical protein